MATTYSGIECPNCKSNDGYKIFEAWEYRWTVICSSCGYEYYAKLKRDEKGNVMLKDESKGTDTWENIIKELEFDIVKGQGSYNYNYKGAIRSGTFSTSEEFKEVMAEFDALDGPQWTTNK